MLHHQVIISFSPSIKKHNESSATSLSAINEHQANILSPISSLKTAANRALKVAKVWTNMLSARKNTIPGSKLTKHELKTYNLNTTQKEQISKQYLITEQEIERLIYKRDFQQVYIKINELAVKLWNNKEYDYMELILKLVQDQQIQHDILLSGATINQLRFNKKKSHHHQKQSPKKKSQKKSLLIV